MKTLKIIGIVIGSIVVLVLIIVGVVWFLMSRPSKLTKDVTPVVPSAAASQSLDNKWQAFQTEIAQSQPGTPVTITLTQQEVDSKINDGLKTANLPAGLTVSKMNVNLTDGKILLAATVQYSVLSGNAGMVATVDIVNGQPTITVTNIDMGSLPFPQSLKDQLKSLIPQDALFQTNSSFQAQSINISDGLLTIQGITQ
jgi:hypothetical protein